MKKVLLFVFIIVILGIGTYFIIQNEQEKKEKERIKIEQETVLKQKQDVERNELYKEAETLVKKYYVKEAIDLLNSKQELKNEELNNKIKEYQDYLDSYVLYKDNVEHIFFHSLILYPEYLFPNINVKIGGYNEGFSYKRELERMLPLLLEKGYVLYNINDVYAKVDGKMVRKDIYLPEGKKPLILSIDDPALTYGIGFADKMIIDENGKLATEVITPQKQKIVTYDGDVELVVNNFVEEHPEFSYRGAKGIIAATGWEGFLGYELDTIESKTQAKAVADKLKEEGWLFASHSYSHNRTGFYGPGSNTYNIANDIKRWKAKMVPILGETNIFIAPFGYLLKGSGMDVVLYNDFDIYCIVTSKSYNEIFDDYALMGRIEMSGYSYQKYYNYINNHLFDVSKVQDEYRAPVLSN